MIKRFLPKSLLGRSILIIVTPLIVLQLVSGAIFYESHWDKVSLRLARGLAGDIAAMVDLLRETKTEDERARIYQLAAQNMAIVVRLKAGEIMENLPAEQA
ncbi:MAG: two-component sensor histidine kinase, partial [Rhodospirillales bacterium]|nr:two-component sensor histidine kinase [Rhodospirillales bacterium]